MNDRFKELLKTSTNDIMGVKVVDQKKFAELIIRECIDNVQVWEKDSRNHISYMLKNHFDIK
jgi:hypothetical protein